TPSTVPHLVVGAADPPAETSSQAIASLLERWPRELVAAALMGDSVDIAELASILSLPAAALAELVDAAIDEGVFAEEADGLRFAAPTTSAAVLAHAGSSPTTTWLVRARRNVVERCLETG